MYDTTVQPVLFGSIATSFLYLPCEYRIDTESRLATGEEIALAAVLLELSPAHMATFFSAVPEALSRPRKGAQMSHEDSQQPLSFRLGSEVLGSSSKASSLSSTRTKRSHSRGYSAQSLQSSAQASRAASQAASQQSADSQTSRTYSHLASPLQPRARSSRSSCLKSGDLACLEAPMPIQARLKLSIAAMDLSSLAHTEHVYSTDVEIGITAAEPDFALVYGLSIRSKVYRIPLAVAEAKAGDASPAVGLAQASIVAAVGALLLHAVGLPREDCLVPFFAYTGHYEVHAIAYVLKNGFPCVATASSVLDLGSEKGSREAARFRLLLQSRVRRSAEALERIRGPALDELGTKLARILSTTGGLHFAFPSSDFFIKQAQRRASLGTDESLRETLLIFQRLCEHKVPVAAPLTCIPVYQNGGTAETRDFVLKVGVNMVFENLTSLGYEGGLPAEREEFYAWLSAVACAAERTHAAGVVHGDLHPHNVFHRRGRDDSEGMEVVLIDFDSSLRSDVPITKSMQGYRKKRWFPEEYMQVGQPASPLLDYFYLAGVLLAYLQGKGRHFAGPPTKESFGVLQQIMATHLGQLKECCETLRPSCGGYRQTIDSMRKMRLFDVEAARDLLPSTSTCASTQVCASSAAKRVDEALGSMSLHD